MSRRRATQDRRRPSAQRRQRRRRRRAPAGPQEEEEGRRGGAPRKRAEGGRGGPVRSAEEEPGGGAAGGRGGALSRPGACAGAPGPAARRLPAVRRPGALLGPEGPGAPEGGGGGEDPQILASRRKNTASGFLPFSASGGPHRAPGPSKKRFRMENQAWGKGREFRGPRPERIRTSPCLGPNPSDTSVTLPSLSRALQQR